MSYFYFLNLTMLKVTQTLSYRLVIKSHILHQNFITNVKSMTSKCFIIKWWKKGLPFKPYLVLHRQCISQTRAPLLEVSFWGSLVIL